MKLKNIVTILFIIISVVNLHARGLELFNLSYDYSPYNDLDPDDKNLSSEDLKLRRSSFKADLKIPLLLYLDKASFAMLINGISFENIHIDYDQQGSVPQQTSVDNLYSVKYNLVYVQGFNKRWGIEVPLGIGISSDFEESENFEFNDNTINGGLLIKRSLSKGFIKFGALYVSTFGEPQVLPAFGFQWLFADHFLLDMFLPQKAELLFISDRVEAGFKGQISGNKFAITEKSILENYAVKYSQIAVGPVIRVRTFKKAYLYFEGGYLLRRRFEIYDKDDNEVIDFTMNDKWFVKTGLMYRI